MPKVRAFIIDKHNVLIGGKKGTGRAQINNGIPADLVIDVYGLKTIHIKNVHKNLFPYLREMYPEEFGLGVENVMDRIDTAVIDYQREKIQKRTKTDEWLEGYGEAVEVMQEAMNDVTRELKDADKG